MPSVDDPAPPGDPAAEPTARVVPRPRTPQRGRIYAGRGPEAGRGPARGRAAAAGRGVAPVPTNHEPTRQLRPPPPPARPVFVDDSGRRGKLLAWASLLLALAALAL